jgi:hypothetical protein
LQRAAEEALGAKTRPKQNVNFIADHYRRSAADILTSYLRSQQRPAKRQVARCLQKTPWAARQNNIHLEQRQEQPTDRARYITAARYSQRKERRKEPHTENRPSRKQDELNIKIKTNTTPHINEGSESAPVLAPAITKIPP